MIPDVFVLRGGKLVDGTGRRAFSADVVVDHGRLHVVEPGAATGAEVVEVDGMVVSPGFIDTHSHADVEAFLGDDRVHLSRLRQGVTTEVTGNCGFSPFPVPPASGSTVEQFLGVVFGPGSPTFPDVASYQAAVEKTGLASNIAPLVGHGTLRSTVLGYENRASDDGEAKAMQEALGQAMRDGAFGLSTGLCYTPATYAPPSEVEGLAQVVAAQGGVYSTHVRNETDLTEESLQEALSVAAATGVPVHVSHLKVAGRDNWGTSAELLGFLESARQSGVDVTADVYPYTAASTSLHSLLPPWTAQEGMARLFENLADPDWRQRVAEDLVSGVPGWQNLGSAAGWHNVTIATSDQHPEWEGRSVADLSTDSDRSPVDTIARILGGNRGKVVVVIEAMDGSDVEAFMAWPHSMVGSDGIPLPGKPHPRLTGTFPRVLAQYRESLGSLEEAVQRMTGASARRFSIPGRGVIAEGRIADLVVFDENTVRDRSTYEEPWRVPEGIRHVFVAGRPAVWDYEPVDGSAGRVLRKARRAE